MPDKPKKEPKDQNIGVMVTTSLKSELQGIAEDQERSVSQVAGALLERGLDGFRKDGELRPKGKKSGGRGLGVIRARAEEEPHKKTRP